MEARKGATMSPKINCEFCGAACEAKEGALNKRRYCSDLCRISAWTKRELEKRKERERLEFEKRQMEDMKKYDKLK